MSDYEYDEDLYLDIDAFHQTPHPLIAELRGKYFVEFEGNFRRKHVQTSICIRCQVPGVEVDANGYCWICVLDMLTSASHVESVLLRWNRRTHRMLWDQQREWQRQHPSKPAEEKSIWFDNALAKHSRFEWNSNEHLYCLGCDFRQYWAEIPTAAQREAAAREHQFTAAMAELPIDIKGI